MNARRGKLFTDQQCVYRALFSTVHELTLDHPADRLCGVRQQPRKTRLATTSEARIYGTCPHVDLGQCISILYEKMSSTSLASPLTGTHFREKCSM